MIIPSLRQSMYHPSRMQQTLIMRPNIRYRTAQDEAPIGVTRHPYQILHCFPNRSPFGQLWINHLRELQKWNDDARSIAFRTSIRMNRRNETSSSFVLPCMIFILNSFRVDDAYMHPEECELTWFM